MSPSASLLRPPPGAVLDLPYVTPRFLCPGSCHPLGPNRLCAPLGRGLVCTWPVQPVLATPASSSRACPTRDRGALTLPVLLTSEGVGGGGRGRWEVGGRKSGNKGPRDRWTGQAVVCVALYKVQTSGAGVPSCCHGGVGCSPWPSKLRQEEG